MLSDTTDMQCHNTHRKSFACRRCCAAVIALGFYFFLSSCVTFNGGKLQTSAEITKIFEKHRILSDHDYYYSGLQGVPDAIIGIHSDYSLRTDQWQPIDLTSPILQKWIFRMKIVQLVDPQGAWILDPDGNRIGIWYSALRQTAVRLQQNNRVVIAAPQHPRLQEIR